MRRIAAVLVLACGCSDGGASAQVDSSAVVAVAQQTAEKLEEARTQTAANDCRMIAQAAELFQLQKRRPPSSVAELAESGMMNGERKDPWGNGYTVEVQAETIRIVGPGPDQQLGTPDDIRCTSAP